MAKIKNGKREEEETAPVPRKSSQKMGADSEKKTKAAVRKKREPVEQPGQMHLSEDAPSRTDIVTQARLYGPASIETLAEVMQCGTEASRVAAAKSLLDRGFGKVDQSWPSDGEDDQSQGLDANKEAADCDVPPVPFLEGLAPEDLARIASLVWDEAHRQ